MNPNVAAEFAQWLANDQPELFVALYKRALPAVQKAKGLSGFTDVLSSIGSGLSKAVSQVGTFLSSPQGQQTIATLGNAYLQTKAAREAVKVNLQRAQTGQAPAPIQTVYNPNTMQYEAMVTQANGALSPLTPTLANRLSSLPAWVPWAAGAAGVVLLVILATRR